MNGLSTRLTSSGIPVLRVHYSADPQKNPEWAKTASISFGGLNSPRWRKELEIEWGALGGMKLLPMWEQWIAAGRIVIQPFEPIGYKLYSSYDHGWRNPCSYHVYGVDGDGNIVALYEIYGAGIGVLNTAKLIKGEDVILSDGRRFKGNPFAGKETWRIADPQLWAEDQPMNDGTNKSVADLFRRNGVVFQKGEKGGDTMVAEWLHGWFWKDPTQPLFRITTDCPKLVWELGLQRHKELSARVGMNQDQPEELVDKDNHAWDDMKMFLKRFPPKFKQQTPAGTPNTFQWWRKLSKKTGSIQRGAIGSFRI